MGIDLRVIKTKENIEHQLLILLEKYPFDKITVTMIVQYSRINQSTFYRNYKDKYDLLNQIIEKITNELQQWLDQSSFLLIKYENAKNYHSQLKQLLYFYKKNYATIKVLLNASLPYNFNDHITDIFGIALLNSMKQIYKIAPEKESLAILYTTLFATQTTQTLKWWITAPTLLPDNEILNIMTSNIENGLFLSMEQKFL